MGFRIRNSNQFASWKSGEYITPADMLIGQPGSNLPATQSDLLTDETQVRIGFSLRRNTFEGGPKPVDYKAAKKVFNFPYKKQISFLSDLTPKEIKQWYGASQSDIAEVREYLERFNGTILGMDQEQRTITASFSLGDFKAAFLANKPEVIFNNDQSLYYYDPSDFSNSYLESNGAGSESVADAIIGAAIELLDEDYEVSLNDTNSLSTEVSSSAPANEILPARTDYTYYPVEIADFYNYPAHEKTKAGKDVTIGLVGSGGNQFETVFENNNVLREYLKAQGVSTKKLGSLKSPNSPEDFSNPPEWYGESAMDYSIIRSIAPRANLVVSDSDNVVLYESYAELIYDPSVDLISSSVGYPLLPGVMNRREALHELFVDAFLRGKPIVVASGDTGTANNTTFVPKGTAIPDFSDGDSAILSVGGTAFSKNAQKNAWARPYVVNPTTFPPAFSKKSRDKLTGLISEQYTWNQYGKQPVSIMGDRGVAVYPDAASTFTLEDFNGSIDFKGYFFNTTASSGVFGSETTAMPAYQRRNLGNDWKASGRRYPDVSVLAGSNSDKGSSSWYYTLSAQPNSAETAYEPVLNTGGGGTSAGAPLIAGLLANLTSYIRSRFGKEKRLGMINSLLYESYNSRNKNKVLFDVPGGSNNASVFGLAASPDQWSGFTLVYEPEENGVKYLIPVNGTGPGGQLDTNLSSTGKGFDAATGLGSINGQGLLNQITNIFADL